jgi:hypothetical protein
MADPDDAKPDSTVPQARKVRCVNKTSGASAYSMTFRVEVASHGDTGWSGTLGPNESRTFDMANLHLSNGAAMWPAVHVVSHATKKGEHLAYLSTGATATYFCAGSRANPTVTLQSIAAELGTGEDSAAEAPDRAGGDPADIAEG